MKKCAKYLLLMMGVVFLTFSGKTTAKAAEVPAPFTADQLMGVVNAQYAGVNSSHQVIAENVQMTDVTTGLSISVNLTGDIQENRNVTHTVIAMNMSFAGQSQGASQESYTSVENGFLTEYTLDSDTGKWDMERTKLTNSQLALRNAPNIMSGIDTTGSVVTTDGLVYRFTGSVEASLMEDFNEMLEASGVQVNNGAFPVIVEVDAATLLPRSMTVNMTGLTVPEMPEMAVSATAIVVYDGYNQFDGLAVPQSVIANAA